MTQREYNRLITSLMKIEDILARQIYPDNNLVAWELDVTIFMIRRLQSSFNSLEFNRKDEKDGHV